ncbi:MAG TPA: type II toxin-antitoxin system VapB family antitoxin [Rubrivivax sp.]|nr:type II toxin-antitoxin system VapB family antitoxin [Rubrivivax sp.]
MRTNIDIDDDLMAQAMQAGPYSTKKDAVEAGLRLLARQAAYREILKWRGKLQWEGDESIDWTEPRPERTPEVAEPGPRFAARPAKVAGSSKPVAGKRRAGR